MIVLGKPAVLAEAYFYYSKKRLQFKHECDSILVAERKAANKNKINIPKGEQNEQQQ